MESRGKTAARPSNLISLHDFRELTTKKPIKNKYRAQKTKVGEEIIDSKGEAQRYVALTFLERCGKIRDLQRQVRFPLIVNGIHLALIDKRGRSRKLYYYADFTYLEDDVFVIEDFKGKDTDLSRLKRAIVEATTGIPIRITR